MFSGINTRVIIYFLVFIRIPTYEEELQCYVCTDCDIVNEIHIASCKKPEESVTDSTVTDQPSTDALYTNTVNTEETDNTIVPTTEPPVTDGSYTEDTDKPNTNVPNTEPPVTDKFSTEYTDTPNTNVPSTTSPITDGSYTDDKDKTTTNIPSTEGALTDVSYVDVTEQSSTNILSTEPPLADRFLEDSDKPNTKIPSSELPVIDGHDINTPYTEAPTSNALITDVSSMISPETDKPSNLAESSHTDVPKTQTDIGLILNKGQIPNDPENPSSGSDKSILRIKEIEAHRIESNIQCVVTSFKENNISKVLRGCSFQAGDAKERCRELIGSGFTGNLTRCTVCEKNLCNKASALGAVFSIILLSLFLNVS